MATKKSTKAQAAVLVTETAATPVAVVAKPKRERKPKPPKHFLTTAATVRAYLAEDPTRAITAVTLREERPNGKDYGKYVGYVRRALDETALRVKRGTDELPPLDAKGALASTGFSDWTKAIAGRVLDLSTMPTPAETVEAARALFEGA